MGIFISYRREDSGPYAGRLYDALSGHFGSDQVFLDIDHIEPGERFADAIDRAVGACDALLAVIGPDWLSIEDRSRRRRLDNPKDTLRMEIATALRRDDVQVVPVLIGATPMPEREDLPEALAALADHNALRISDEGWKDQVQRLIRSLERVVGRGPAVPNEVGGPPPPPPPGPPALDRTFPGNWTFQFQRPGMGAGQGPLVVDPTGVFQGQVQSFTGLWNFGGQWQIIGPNQVHMLGSQNNGMQVMPYEVIIQFTSVSPSQLIGATSTGESVLFVRAG